MVLDTAAAQATPQTSGIALSRVRPQIADVGFIVRAEDFPGLRLEVVF